MKYLIILLLALSCSFPLAAQFQGGDGSGYDSGQSSPQLILGRGNTAPLNSLKLFPNPCLKQLNWTTALPRHSSVEVIDLNGKIVLQSELSPFRNSISVDALPAGSYILKIRSLEQILSAGFRKLE